MKSIRRHFLLSLMLGAAVLLVFTSVALYVYSRAFLIRKFDTALRSKALALVTLTEQSGAEVKLNFADEFMPEFEQPERPEYFQVWLSDGQVLERSRSLRGGDLPLQTGSVAQPIYWDLRLPDGREGRAVGIQFAAQRVDRKPGVLYSSSAGSGATVALVLARERTSLNRALTAFRVALQAFAVLLLAALGVLVALVVHRGLAPLQLVGERAAAIDASSLQERFPVNGMPRELRPICERLNDLLARLQEAFQRERRISADIAHELGTPLAELRTLSEVAIKWPEDATGAAAAFRDVLAIVAKMETMVTGLVALARSEDGKLPIHQESVAMAELVEEIWVPLGVPAQRKQVKFAMDVPRDLRLQSDPILLRHILANLLRNAVEYSPAGGWVRIRATTHDAQFDLNVENTTDNLAADDLPRLFERFWRKDSARTSSGHGGLGLTLAQTVAHALGLSLSAHMPTPGVLRMVLCGPMKLTG
jgi:signal transduction histidine kinase